MSEKTTDVEVFRHEHIVSRFLETRDIQVSSVPLLTTYIALASE
jgi:hypothetical protein